LTKITGNPKYKQAAMDSIEYAFENLRNPNGLLHWGGHEAYDLGADRPCGRGIHEFKEFYPYYELMWEVDPNATEKFIEAFWSAHIMDWSRLDMNRHAQMEKPLPRPWKQEYKGEPVFFESTNGTSISASRDLIYAAAWLTKLSAAKEPLIWGKRLAHRYVETRHPNTGISYWCFSISSGGVDKNGSSDDVIRKLVPGTGDFPWNELTNRIARECCIGYFMPTPEISVQRQVCLWQNHFLLGEMLGSEGKEFKQWALEELTAFGKASYRKMDNVFVPILTDGTNLEGYVVTEDGPLGPKGVVLELVPADPSVLWAYSMGYRVTEDRFMWEMAQNIAKGNEFGDIGATAKVRPQLLTSTDCSNPYALLAFMELHRCTGHNEFWDMAKRIGDNILARRFQKGFFVASNKHIYTKFDAVDSLALLHLHAILLRGIPLIPEVWPSTPFFEDRYRDKDQILDNQLIYPLTESAEPPLSLQEAGAIGNLDLVKTLIENGAEVDGREDSFFRTALHRAAMSGHKDVVEFLLSKGAQIDPWNGFPGGTPLDYAAEKGHKEIVEMLIARGADVNAKRTGYPQGDTPIHSAVRAGHKDIVELLIAKSANINAKNNEGQPALHIAIQRNRTEIVRTMKARRRLMLL
jgi:pectate lyase